MQLISLDTVRHRLQVGVPLPFNVRNGDQTLLLAKGHMIVSREQLSSLFERGMLVDIEEIQTTTERIRQAPRAALPGLWAETIECVERALVRLPSEGFEAVVDDVSQPLLGLVERDPDLALFQVLRQHGNMPTQYGVNHSIHCAIAAFMTAHRLGWDAGALELAFKASLTMNVSMFDLQGELATQVTSPSVKQRELIQTHPRRSRRMLEEAGVANADWLTAVEQHHEAPDGGGYPDGLRELVPLAQLIRQCDIYTAKLSPRLSREAMAADLAARTLFAESPRDPLAVALIKEFGLYPPGTFVRMASGEVGIVVRRGAAAHTPVVAALTSPDRTQHAEPQRRDTAHPQHAIAGVIVPAADVKVTLETVVALPFEA